MTVVTETPPRRASKAERDKVHAWVRKYQREFYLHILRINVIFHDYPEDAEATDGEPSCAAKMDSDLSIRYHVATLQVYPKFFNDDDEDQEFAVCHEMMHIVTYRLSRLIGHQHEGNLVTPGEAADADEAVTDLLARIVMFGGNAKKTEKPIRVKKVKAASATKAKK